MTTYLDLINQVLTRLREDKITAAGVDSTPYLRFIGSAVNDAKEMVEDAWQWSGNRGTDYIPLVPKTNNPRYSLPNSSDSGYVLKRIAIFENSNPVDPNGGILSDRTYLRWVDIPKIRQLYQSRPTETGVTTDFCVVGRDDADNLQIAIYPLVPGLAPNVQYWLEVDRYSDRPPLVAATDKLKVPSLPVYSYATALASRERGEVGGTPTSELFAIADKHLSDAIAKDSALFANELIWDAGQRDNRTNFRTA